MLKCFLVFSEEVIVAHLHHLLRVVERSELILLHDYQIAVWNLIKNLVVGKVKGLLECRNLSEEAVVAYNLCFAVRLATFLAKADSFQKFSTDASEYAVSKASVISSIVPSISSSARDSSPLIMHDNAQQSGFGFPIDSKRPLMVFASCMSDR